MNEKPNPADEPLSQDELESTAGAEGVCAETVASSAQVTYLCGPGTATGTD